MTQRETLAARQGAQLQRAKLMLDAAEREQRGLTASEEGTQQAILADVAAITARLETLDAAAAMNTAITQATGGNGGRPVVRASLGAQFVESDTYTWLKTTQGSRPAGQWTSPSSELQASVISEDSASAGDLVVPDYRPGILPLATRPLTVLDLLAPGTTTGNAITYMKETTFTNSADTLVEGGLKPESTLIFDAASDPVRKIAHWVPVTDEMLEDVPAIRSYIDTRLRHGVDLATDDQLLNGSITAPDIVGFLARTGLAAAVVRSGSVTNVDALLSQIVAIWTAQSIMPDGIVMNPTQWETILKSKDGNGQYYGNGPFSTLQRPTLWGLPVAVSPVIVAGTALVGAFRVSSQFFSKGGIRVEASNSHADFFIRNLTAIRAERRGALAVYRPAAFGVVSSLT